MASGCCFKNTVVLPKACTVNYERAKVYWLMFIFFAKLGILYLKYHRGHVGNVRRKIYLFQR